MEARNRCFDQRVPEEINRKIVDHLSDINMPLSEHARNYLISEGIKPETIIKTGSPMLEVLEANMDKILNELQGKENRTALFRTAIALILKGEEHLFEGKVEGYISKDKQGDEGFGYDPIFLPENEKRSFAQMSMEEKGAVSHRGRAVKKLVAYLNNSSTPTTEQ